MRELFIREKSNPIITSENMPYDVNTVFNPGVAEYDGQIVLLLRVEDLQGQSHLTVARSKNGVDNWQIETKPLIFPQPDTEEYAYEQFGCEDARITYIPEKDEYFICYTAYSPVGPGVATAVTKDFASVKKFGLTFPPNNKDAAIFPRKFNDKWVMLHRPVAGDIEHIWLTSSSDLVHWGEPKCLLPERGGPWWDAARVGAGAPPIETNEGWLMIYHGVKTTTSGAIYRLGLALVDKGNPYKLLYRCPRWIFGPNEPYERHGDVSNVVYTCGTIIRGDELWMYYGGADSCVCLARAKLNDLITELTDFSGRAASHHFIKCGVG